MQIGLHNLKRRRARGISRHTRLNHDAQRVARALFHQLRSGKGACWRNAVSRTDLVVWTPLR